MTNFSKAMVTMLALTTLTLAAGFLAAPATAQGPRPTVTSGSPSTPMFITTSAIIAVGVGQTFKTDGVEVPSCLKGMTFLATAVQAVPVRSALRGERHQPAKVVGLSERLSGHTQRVVFPSVDSDR